MSIAWSFDAELAGLRVLEVGIVCRGVVSCSKLLDISSTFVLLASAVDDLEVALDSDSLFRA